MKAYQSPVASALPLPDIPFPARQTASSLLSASSEELEVDVAVIGASVAGLFVAQAIARLGYRCALIGPDPGVSRQPSGFDQRIFALSPASWQWIEQQGLRAAMDQARFGTIDRMHLEAPHWGTPSPIVLESYRSAMDQLAITVEQAELIAAGQQAVAITGVLRIYESLVALDPPSSNASKSITQGLNAYARQAAFRRLQLESGKLIRARLIVGCDGAHSPLRRLAKIPVNRYDFESTAVVANFECAGHHRHSAFQWFTDQGILALLPLPGQNLSMVWSAPKSLANSLMALDHAGLCQRVQALLEILAAPLPALRSCISEPASFDLVELICERPVDARMVLIADAAHVVHPMAGQGLNLGIGDIVALTELLADAAVRHDPGAATTLNRFERRRAEAVMAMSLLTKALFHVFRAPPKPLMQGLGAWAWTRVANSSLLQTALIRQASRHGP